MTVNDFCSKVNLPLFCSRMGITGYQFLKLPTFGWLAHNPEKTVILNIFELFKHEDRPKLYAIVTKEKKDYLDFDMAYTETTDKSITANYVKHELWSAALRFGQKELETHKVNFRGKRIEIKTLLRDSGYEPLLHSKIGVLTRTLMERFNMLDWPVKDGRGKLLIPSFYAPGRLASLEYCYWDSPRDLFPLYINDEKGWYGNIEEPNIVSSLPALWTNKGFTWDYKCDHWLDKPVDLSPDLDIPAQVKVWAEAKTAVFTKNPLDSIVEGNSPDEIEKYVGMLSYHQLLELEEKTGQKFTGVWRKAKETQVRVGSETYLRKDNCYYGYKKGKLVQLSTFAVDIDRIVKRGECFFRIGRVFIGNKSAPFELPDWVFTEPSSFLAGIRRVCLNSGLGVPVLLPALRAYVVPVVESFNQGTPIEIDY